MRDPINKGPVPVIAMIDIGITIFESSPDCVKLLDTEGHLLSMNRNGQCAMEIDDFRLVEGLPWASLWPAEATGAVRTALAAAKNGGTGHFEAFCPTAKGSPRWWDVIVTPVLAPSGRIESILSISRDVTSVKRADEELRASRALFSSILESSSDGIYGIGPDDICTFINRAGAAMLGYESAELIGKPLHALIHHQDPDGPPFPASGERARVDDEVFWHKDGSPLPVSYSVSPMSADGSHAGTVVSFADITQRKRAEAALFESRESLGKIVSQAATGVVQTNADGRVTLVNQKYCDMLGYAESELLGKSVSDDTAAEFLPATLALMNRLAEGGPAKVLEKQYVRKNGSLLWATSSVNALRGPDGAFLGLVAIVVDITERKEAEEKLRDAGRRKDEFLAMLAHELRNPLAPIGAAAELLKLGNSDERRVRQTSEIISRQVNHMTNLVDDLLDVSRVSRGLVTLDKAPLDMLHIVTDAVEQVNPLIHAKQHRLALHLSPDAAMIMGDKKRLIQIVANLLGNAAKYTPPGGAILLRTEVKGAQVILTVIDDGIGIDQQLAGRVFDLFTQAEHTPDRSSGGLGLGLALVKNLVELHGGTVTCYSEGANTGSTFCVTLPRLAQSKPQSPGAAAPAQPTSHATPLRILLVDDNVDAAMTLSMLLEVSNHEVRVEHSARRAIEAIEQQTFDVCLLDIGLPEMDGNALARHLRAHPKTASCVLIAITGYGQESDRQNTAAAGFDHHFVKPVDSQKLLSVLGECTLTRTQSISA